MAVTLTLELENQTRDGFAEAIDDLRRMGEEARSTSQLVNDLNLTLTSDSPLQAGAMMSMLSDNIQTTTGSTEMLAQSVFTLDGVLNSTLASLESVSHSIAALGDASATTDQQNSTLTGGLHDLTEATESSSCSAAESGEGWLKLADAMSVLHGGFYGTQTGLQLVSQFALQMAEDGNTAFQRLVKAGDGLLAMMARLGENDHLEHMIVRLADAVEFVIPYFEQFGNFVLATFTHVEHAITGVTQMVLRAGETIGLFSEGTSEAFTQIRQEEAAAEQRQRQSDNQRHQRRQLETEQRDADDRAARDAQLIDPAAELRTEGERRLRMSGLTELDGEGGVNAHIQAVQADQQHLVSQLTGAGYDPAEFAEVMENKRELEALERRRLELLRQQVQAEQQLSATPHGATNTFTDAPSDESMWTAAAHPVSQFSFDMPGQVPFPAAGPHRNSEVTAVVQELTGVTAEVIQNRSQIDAAAVDAIRQLTRTAQRQAAESNSILEQLDHVIQQLHALFGRGISATTRAQRAGFSR